MRVVPKCFCSGTIIDELRLRAKQSDLCWKTRQNDGDLKIFWSRVTVINSFWCHFYKTREKIAKM